MLFVNNKCHEWLNIIYYYVSIIINTYYFIISFWLILLNTHFFFFKSKFYIHLDTLKNCKYYIFMSYPIIIKKKKQLVNQLMFLFL